VQGPEHLDELTTQPVLEGDPPCVDPAGDQQHLFVLDVDALDRADAGGEVEHLRLGEWLGGVPAARVLPDHRRVEAFLDGGPDRERRREVQAIDHQVRPVSHANLVDLAEQVVGGVASEHVGQARLDTHGDQRQPPGLRPGTGARELRVTQLDPAFRIGSGWMRVRQRHREVQIVRAGRERPVEDRHHEPGIDRVDHMCDALVLAQRGNLRCRRCVQPGGRQPWIIHAGHHTGGPVEIAVGHDEVFEELATAGDGRGGGTDRAGADQEDSHRFHHPGQLKPQFTKRTATEILVNGCQSCDKRSRDPTASPHRGRHR
jgi:hypothetical protein